MACPPQAPQIAAWNSRGPSLERARLAIARHDGHRWGSLVNPLLEKKACSPAEKVNSSVQSRQVRLRSWYTLSRPSSGTGRRDGEARATEWASGRRRARQRGGARPVGPGSEPGTHDREDRRAVKPFCPLYPQCLRAWNRSRRLGVGAPCVPSCDLRQSPPLHSSPRPASALPDPRLGARPHRPRADRRAAHRAHRADHPEHPRARSA
jgi:hypothetical protein